MAINYDSGYAMAGADERFLGEYLQTLVANWRTIAYVTLAFALLGTTYAFLAPKTYRADVLFHVMEKSDTSKKDNSLPPLTGMFDTKTSANGEIEMLKSRLVTEETVRRLHLDIAAHPREMPLVGGLMAGLVQPVMRGAAARSRYRASIRRRRFTSARSRWSRAPTAHTCCAIRTALRFCRAAWART